MSKTLDTDHPYIYFEEFDALPKRKTKTVLVISRHTDEPLAIIKWFGRWRQYCLFPCKDTIFNVGCLEEINRQIKAMMDERKKDLQR